MDQTVDIVILGGGLAGLSVGASLCGHRRIGLIEPEELLCRHASGRAAAMFIPTYGTPVITGLARASRPQLAEGLLSPRPALHLAEDMRDLIDLQDRGRGRVIDAAEIAHLAPGLKTGWRDRAYLETDAGLIDLGALIDRFRRVLSRQGAILTNRTPTVIGRRSGRWRIETPGGTLGAEVLVNAAGPWADQVAVAAGIAPLGLESFRRTLIEAAPPAGLDVADWPIIKAADGRGYLRPTGRGVWASACEEEPSRPCDAQPDDVATARAWDRLAVLTGRKGWEPRARWAGLRTFAADRSPVVGWDPTAPGFFWAAGLGGAGVQCAPAIGRSAAALIMGDALPEDVLAQGVTPDALSPGRCGGQASASRV